MDFRYLEAYYLVAKEKSFNKAAKALSVSPSAITRQIKLLEESCSKPLLVRSTKNVSLTNHGQNLYNSINRFYSELQQYNLTEHDVIVRIGAMEGILKEKILPAISQIEKKNNWNIHIEVNSPNILTEQLSRGYLDFIFISNANETTIPKQFEIIPFCVEKIVLISKKKVDLKEIHNHTWICFEHNTWITRYGKKKSSKIIRVNNMDSLIKLVKSGSGIAMIPEHCIGDKKGIACQEVKKYGKQQVSIVTFPKSSRPDYIKQFLTYLGLEG